MSSSGVLTIGVPESELDDVPFLGSTNFDEYDAIIWNFSSFANEVADKQMPLDGALIESRLSQLTSWVKRGNTLTVLGAKQLWISALQSFATGFQPLDGLEFENAHGSRIEACGPSEARDVLTALAEQLSYSSLISGDDLAPLMRVRAATRGRSQTVGGFRQMGAGRVIYLPCPKRGSNWSIALAGFIDLPALLSRPLDELPTWITDFYSQSENDAATAIAVLQGKVALLNVEMARHQEVMNDVALLKQLITGTGPAFALAAAVALKELGFTVLEGQHPRADLLTTDGERIAAVEVKGVDGPIKEQYLRQVDAWMSEIDHILSVPPQERDREQAEYAKIISAMGAPMENASDCKGILIVGTFRSTPVDQRKHPDIPDALNRRLASRDVCVLTGLQLFGLVMAVRKEPDLLKTLKREIFDTKGRLNMALDWNQFISQRLRP